MGYCLLVGSSCTISVGCDIDEQAYHQTGVSSVPVEVRVDGADDTGVDVVGAAVLVVAVMILVICLKHPRHWISW